MKIVRTVLYLFLNWTKFQSGGKFCTKLPRSLLRLFEFYLYHSLHNQFQLPSHFNSITLLKWNLSIADIISRNGWNHAHSLVEKPLYNGHQFLEQTAFLY